MGCFSQTTARPYHPNAALTGPPGSGKSVFMKALSGQLQKEARLKARGTLLRFGFAIGLLCFGFMLHPRCRSCAFDAQHACTAERPMNNNKNLILSPCRYAVSTALLAAAGDGRGAGEQQPTPRDASRP